FPLIAAIQTTAVDQAATVANGSSTVAGTTGFDQAGRSDRRNTRQLGVAPDLTADESPRRRATQMRSSPDSVRRLSPEDDRRPLDSLAVCGSWPTAGSGRKKRGA